MHGHDGCADTTDAQTRRMRARTPPYVVSAFRRTYTDRMAKVVAVIGASSNRSKFGNRAVRAFQQQGYTVVPINPHEAEVEGLKSYPSVMDVPGTIDMASIYLPPEIGVQVLDDIARKGIAEVWVNPGAESDALIARAKALNIQPIVACSIVAIGENPYRL
jgi:predicted CoA-binding protein